MSKLISMSESCWVQIPLLHLLSDSLCVLDLCKRFWETGHEEDKMSSGSKTLCTAYEEYCCRQWKSKTWHRIWETRLRIPWKSQWKDGCQVPILKEETGRKGWSMLNDTRTKRCYGIIKMGNIFEKTSFFVLIVVRRRPVEINVAHLWECNWTDWTFT